MKKLISIILSTIILITSFLSFNAYAKEVNQAYSYKSLNGENVYYYKDVSGQTYVIENGIKEYIAVPALVEKVTDSVQIAELEEEVSEARLSKSITKNSSVSLKSSSLSYSKTMNMASGADVTDILNITSSYFNLKCSQLSPSGAKRGFSYYIYFSPDGSNWSRALYVNQSLLFTTKHRMADLGNGPYIKISMWSYYGTVSSCLLSLT